MRIELLFFNLGYLFDVSALKQSPETESEEKMKEDKPLIPEKKEMIPEKKIEETKPPVPIKKSRIPEKKKVVQIPAPKQMNPFELAMQKKKEEREN